MKKSGWMALKGMLTVVLIIAAARLASYGAGLVREKEQLKELQQEMRHAEESISSVEKRKTEKEEISVTAKTGEASGAEHVEAKAFKTESSTVENPVTEYSKAGSGTGAKEVTDGAIPKENTDGSPPVNAERFSEFTKRNPDFAGWLRIDETSIDYPVMRDPEEADFYLHHDFEKKESKSGIPYLAKDCTPDSDSLLIYAHNMKNGTMFSGLINYSEEAYYQEHPVIEFDTLQGNGTYAILAVFREKVHFQDEQDVFRYYNYCGDLTEIEFNTYVETIKEISLYNTGRTAVYGQQLLALSTCSYHTENGRFVVVAVKENPN